MRERKRERDHIAQRCKLLKPNKHQESQFPSLSEREKKIIKNRAWKFLLKVRASKKRKNIIK